MLCAVEPMEEIHRQNEVEVEEEEAKAPSKKEEENEGTQQIDKTPLFLQHTGFLPSLARSLCFATVKQTVGLKQIVTAGYECH